MIISFLKHLKKHLQNPWILMAAICLVVYVYVLAGNIWKPFATDEIYNAGWAHGIAEIGTPAYYSGEDVEVFARLKEPVSHPPLHVNLLAVLILIFGMKYWALRLLGVIFFVASLWFLRARVFRQVTHPNEQLVLTGAFLIFNPLFVQESIVLAIEAQAFWFPMLLFFYAFYQESVRPSKLRFYPYLWSTLGIFTLLWLKETNYPIYMSFCLGFLVILRRFRRIPAFILAGAIATALFWGSWLLYCNITGADVWSWWDFTVKNKMLRGSSNGLMQIIESRGIDAAIRKVLSSMQVTATWVSLPYVVLFATAIAVRLRDIILRRTPIAFMEMLALYALMLLGVCKVLRPTDVFIKYEVPAHLLAAIFMADVFVTMLKKEAGALLFILCAGIIAAIAMWQDFPDRILIGKESFDRHFIYSILISGIVGAGFWLLQKKQVVVSFALGLITAIVWLNSCLYIHQSSNDYTTGQSLGNYGEELVSPIQYLKTHLKNGEAFAAFKDIQFNMRFVEGKDKSPTYETRTFTKRKIRTKSKSKRKRIEKMKAKILDSGDIRFIMVDRFSYSSSGIRYLMKHGYRRTVQLGDHWVYEKQQDPKSSRRKSSRQRR